MLDQKIKKFHFKIFKNRFFSKFSTKKFRKIEISDICASVKNLTLYCLERRTSRLSIQQIISRRKASLDFFSIFRKSLTVVEKTKSVHKSRDVLRTIFWRRYSKSAPEITYSCTVSTLLDKICFSRKIFRKFRWKKILFIGKLWGPKIHLALESRTIHFAN